MKQENELYIDHEVRIRVVENAVTDIKKEITVAVSEFNSKINLLIGVLIGSVILPVVLHSFHLM